MLGFVVQTEAGLKDQQENFWGVCVTVQEFQHHWVQPLGSLTLTQVMEDQNLEDQIPVDQVLKDQVLEDQFPEDP